MTYKVEISPEAQAIVTDEDIAWAKQEAEQIAKERNKDLFLITIFPDGDYLSYKPTYHSTIVRIRRITGYFSQVQNFNDAKLAELRDRTTQV